MAPWHRSFWKSFWFALLRSKEDKRARKFVLVILAMLVSILAEAWVVFVLPAKEGQGTFQVSLNGLVAATGLIAFFLIRRSNRKQGELLNFSLTGQNVRQFPEQVALTVQSYLEDRTVIVASLLARAAGEIYLASHELPAGAEVVTRQIQNSMLRRLGLWEKLDSAERELIIAADGLWTIEQRMEAIIWCEQLRLLRWTLQIDAELIPLAHSPRPDYSLAHLQLLTRESISNGKPLRASWDLRRERDIALEYAARIVAELRERSLIADSPELSDWTKQLREQSLGASVDYTAGSKTIGDLSDDDLRLLGIIANARAQYAGYLVDQLSAAGPVRFLEWSQRAMSSNG